MELKSVHWELTGSHCQHFVLRAGGRNLELAGNNGRGEGVVAAGLELLREPREDAAAVMTHRARLPVDETLGRPDLAAEGLDDSLMSEADAEGGDSRGESPDESPPSASASDIRRLAPR